MCKHVSVYNLHSKRATFYIQNNVEEAIYYLKEYDTNQTALNYTTKDQRTYIANSSLTDEELSKMFGMHVSLVKHIRQTHQS